ncbi:related to peptide synthetase [Cephalotrichum gorgonifer]|uniref:Related to peptide synthetase n=1 Tax=Cephalotrichum gorgonifer TaxID=2041049 RepID=A0AAE8SYT0_9PEZI|nr:related to peptide synthetase [Cephalotrichum gorgonifer]
MATYPTTKPRLPRLDTMMESSYEEPMSERLVTAIAKILDIQRDDIFLFDSFADLGGDDATAGDLVTSCSTLGMTLSEDDILRCKTIAELQTCIRPSQGATPPLHSRSNSLGDSDDWSSRVSEIFSVENRRSTDASESSSTPSRQSSTSKSTDHSLAISVTEELLVSTSQVPRATIIRPKAGYFEGKLVAFLTLSDISGEPEEESSGPSEIVLIPHSHHHYAGAQVAALRYLLENSTAITAVPTAWIILQQMPLTPFGANDRRRLQTWIQNMNEELYQEIMSVENQELLQEPSTEMERSLQRLISTVLRAPVERIGMNFSFKQLGGDEFSALQLVAECKSKGIHLTTDDIAQSDSIAHLAFLASYKGNLAPTKWDEEKETGASFELSPMQRLYFQTGVGGDYDARKNQSWEYRFNQSLLLKINTPMELDDVHAAVEAVVGHHAMLRARFTMSDEGTWTQSILSSICKSYHFGHHVISTNDEVLDVIRKTQSLIDIEAGPLFAAELIHTTDGQQMLFVVAHHLVVDLTSWRVIVHDLNELLQSGSLHSERAMPFQRWNELQEAEIRSLDHPPALSLDAVAGDFAFWGLDASRNTYGDAEEVSFALAPELSSILQTACNQAFRTDSTDIYLATLLLSFCQTFPERAPPAIWSQEHGRETWDPKSVDVAQTVGWFTTLCPIRMYAESSEDFVAVLRRMKDTRRAIPRHGWAYFASRFLGRDPESFLSQDWPFEIMFTYGGSLQQLEAENGILEQLPIPGRALDSTTSDIGPRVGRAALFEVSTMMDQGIAKVKFLYNRESAHQDRIAAWVTNFEHLLLEAIGRLRYRAPELTLADVPLLGITYDGLAKLNGDRLRALGVSSARDIENVYPVTPLQQEVLMSQARAPETCHIHAIFQFSPEPNTAVDSTKLCTAWQQTVAKYASLRTVFIESVSEDALFDQVVLRKCSPTMLFIDAGPTDDALLALNSLPPLQCSPSEPRHRLSFCQNSASTFLKLEVSQAICDVASLEKIAGDLKRAYTCNNVSKKNLELSYSGYIQSFRDARVGSKVEFWLAQLRNCKPSLFPALWTPADGRTQVTSLKLGIPEADLDAYCRLAAVKRTTVLRLAWGLVLRNYTGSSHVCFGYRHTGRDAPQAPVGIDTAVGPFESTIVCSMDLSSHRSLSSAVQSAEDELSVCLPHQFTPVSEIQNALGLSGAPLFNTCLSFLDEHRGLKSKFNSARAQSQLDCVMYYNTLDQDLSVSVTVNGGLLDVTIAHRILTGLQAENVANALGSAIRCVIDSPNGSVGGVDLYSARDQEQLPSPAIQVEEPKAQILVHELVEMIVRDDPDAPAVAAWDGRFCYRQLSNLVSRLAHHLVDLGLEPGTPVPVILGKSRWSAVTILAVLKSGGCFVPLDADDPSFTQKIVKQLKSSIVLATDLESSKRLELQVSSLIVVNESLFSTSLLGEKECPTVSMGDAACMIFHTASNKSRPAKGIFFTQSSLSSAFVGQGPALRINVSSRVLQLSAFSSDTALSEILTTLVNGGCVCVPGAAERVVDIAGAINRLGVNWTYFTPVLARRLLPSSIPTVQTICFRTRRLDEDTFSRWAGKTRMLLSYGTSDICPLGISVTEVTSPLQLQRIAPPFIGKFWIVNPEDHRRLMPVGAIGELVIESPTLAHKLSKDSSPAEILRSQQIRAASDDASTTRFFKTGHRVRYMNDGTLEFITSSRDDVLLEGNIIPVPTVEQHIRRCLGTGSEVVVEMVTSKDDASILTAFVELGAHFDGPDDLSLLSATSRERAFMIRKLAESYFQTVLPSYMLPRAFVPVRTLPMTSSLKIHRRKLQKLAGNLTKSDLLSLSTVADPEGITTPDIKPLPLTQVEERMRDIWASLLHLDPATISATQSFFRLGGDTHLVSKLIIACRKAGLLVPLAAVLRNASLTELCQSITLSEDPFMHMLPCPQPAAAATSVEYSSVIRHVIDVVAPEAGIPSSSIVDAALATTTQIRGLESALRDPRAGVDHVVLNFSGFVEAKRIESACRDLATAHPILSTAFVAHNRKIYQVVTSPAASLDFTRVHCPSWRLSAILEKTVKKEQSSPISMSRPITRFTFLDGGKHSALIIRLSAAQYSSSSLPLLLQDLKRIYAGANPELRRPAFADFSRAALAANAHAVPYWASLLHGASITQVLTHTKPSKPTSTPRTITRSVTVSPSVTTEVGITFDTVLKAAWSVVLATLSSSADVTFGEVVDGKHVRMPTQCSSGVLGPVQNVIPVRVQFDGPGTPLDLLRGIHAQRLAGIPHENLGFYDVVEKCTPWPYWSRLSTVVHHLYREGLGDISPFFLGGAECTASVVESAAKDLPDLLVSSVQPTPDLSSVSITFCESRIPVSFAEKALDMLASTINSLSSLQDAIIPSASDLASAERQIPLPLVDIDAPVQPATPDPAAQELIAKAWDDLLDPRAHGVPEEHVPTASFYDLWGSLIPGHLLASRLTASLSAHEISVSTEEVIDNASQLKQLELVSRKLRAREKAGWKGLRRISPRETKAVAPWAATAAGAAGPVSPIPEDGDCVFSPLEEVISPMSPSSNDPFSVAGALSPSPESPSDGGMRRRASKVFGRMSMSMLSHSHSQPKAISP